MADTYTLTAQPRDPGIKARALRRAGMVPGVVYGRQVAATSVQIESASLSRLLQRTGGSTIVALRIEGQPEPYQVLIREVQRDPVSRRVQHVDLYAVSADQPVRAEVPLVLHGEAPVVELGGVVVQVLDLLHIEALPRDLPRSIAVDATKLVDFDSGYTVADLTIPEGVTVLTPETTGVVSVTVSAAQAEEEAEAAEAAEAAAEAEAEAEEGEESA